MRMANPILGDVVIQKKSVSVLIELSTGKKISGNVFMSANQRLQDLINGDRTFLPVQSNNDGQVEYFLLNKSFIIYFQEKI